MVGRGVFCNRTLNLRSIRAIGYDMDYTLVHYHVGGVGAARLRARAGSVSSRPAGPSTSSQFDPRA